ncbi:type II 3-dehydroquinate dehydratase [Spelaeicoccus albus]|uniref:3-dehydroquinate dehydratase n=1 Tax=Spelaeicoccus albus TaxID=1280376 RepID=A0A7Z0D0E7_9MICO|nr:type II 3-dehydroquinate dehydratase [Spelaeicoccus albus]NYI67271.1 3-dehydroquinate dehydratase-2 [Spelaeicoccus albus]
MTDALPRILLLNGPNLNALGLREPELYGRHTLDDAEQLAQGRAASAGFGLDALQSNHEGALIDRIHQARTTHAGIVINPGGLAHTSVALADAIRSVALPTIEVHVTNVYRREEFRHHSYLSAAAEAVIAGAGVAGYGLAVDCLVELLAEK